MFAERLGKAGCFQADWRHSARPLMNLKPASRIAASTAVKAVRAIWHA
jgi:hypothetical protein